MRTPLRVVHSGMRPMLPPGYTLAVTPYFKHEGRYRWSIAVEGVVKERSDVSYPDEATALLAGLARAKELAAPPLGAFAP